MPVGSGALVVYNDELLLIGGMTDWNEENLKIFSLNGDRWSVRSTLETSHVFFSAFGIKDESLIC